MSDAERQARGAKVLSEMLGDQAERVRQTWREICPEFEEYVIGLVAGEFWARPGLDRRTKSLVTIATLAAQGRTLGLELNIRMALNNGATRQEVIETLLHIAPYAGFPACWEGLALAKKVFEASS
ncbi:MAG: carboxymuconolactone decarboxylase family protein [Gemmataceae bacterium]